MKNGGWCRCLRMLRIKRYVAPKLLKKGILNIQFRWKTSSKKITSLEQKYQTRATNSTQTWAKSGFRATYLSRSSTFLSKADSRANWSTSWITQKSARFWTNKSKRVWTWFQKDLSQMQNGALNIRNMIFCSHWKFWMENLYAILCCQILLKYFRTFSKRRQRRKKNWWRIPLKKRSKLA